MKKKKPVWRWLLLPLLPLAMLTGFIVGFIRGLKGDEYEKLR